MASAALLATACSATTKPTAAPTQTPTANAPTSTSPSATASPAALSRFYKQKLGWRSCGGGFTCASLLVPIDYANPSGGTLEVAVIRKKSTGSHHGSLIINPGGPGASGVQFEREAAFAYANLNRHFDLVSFDPRGVGASRPIRCLSTAQLDAWFHADPTLATKQSRAAYIALSKQFADGCWKRNGSYLEHVGTIDAARDMDVLRAALGDAKLTYYGASYGTFMGAKYAQLFPTRIRAMVLDGAVNPADDTITIDIVQSGGFETDLTDFVSWCVKQGSCPLGATTSSAESGLDGLEVHVRDHPEAVGSRSLGAGEFFNGLADALYTTSLWPTLRDGLANASHGNGGVMLGLSDELTERQHGSYSNLMESNMAINCIDRDSPRTIAAFDAAAPRARRTSPHFGIPILYSSLPCAYWHVPPVEKAHPVSAPGAPPILVIGTTHDPATPYVDAQALVAQLGTAGRLLTLDGDGHTAYLRGDPCITSYVDDYLNTARAPRGSPRCG